MKPGTQLGPYEIAATIGAGGMGEIIRARDTRLNRDVALKVLPKDFAFDPERLRRFEQEAKALAALNHPNLLTIHDAGVHEGAPFLVTELLEGKTLREELNGRALPPSKAIDYALQITQGLAAAHGKGVVHRDLKPENIFIIRDGRVKILDFGLAKLSDGGNLTCAEAVSVYVEDDSMLHTTNPRMAMGTPAYMSPEQVRGELAAHRADIGLNYSRADTGRSSRPGHDFCGRHRFQQWFFCSYRPTDCGRNGGGGLLLDADGRHCASPHARDRPGAHHNCVANSSRYYLRDTVRAGPVGRTCQFGSKHRAWQLCLRASCWSSARGGKGAGDFSNVHSGGRQQIRSRLRRDPD
jgi:tRNA A-37 threonylcarbamoyl transferase component Bud32